MKDITIFKLLKVKETLFAYIACSVAMMNFTCYSTFLSVYFNKHHNIEDGKIGFYFFFSSFFYILGSLLCPIIFFYVPRRIQYIFYFFVSTIGFTLMGPSALFNLPDNIYLIVLGMSIQSFFSPICFIQCLPEAMEAVQVKYNIVDNFNPEIDGFLSDTLSSMYTLF